MGTTVVFGNTTLYKPTTGETTETGADGWSDEINQNFDRLAGHNHGTTGGSGVQMAAVGSITATHATTKAAGVATLPAAGDHQHTHGALPVADFGAGVEPHAGYAVTGHGHSNFATSTHTHTTDTSILWEKITDATTGDTVRALVSLPGTTGTFVGIRSSLSGVLDIQQGNTGGAETTVGVGGPGLHFIQRNAEIDGIAPDQVALGMISATKSPTNRMGDTGRTLANFVKTRGDQLIYFARYNSTAGIPATDTMRFFMGSSSDFQYARMTLHVYPGSWVPPAADPWPMSLQVNELGDLWVRGGAQFGGHVVRVGLNHTTLNNDGRESSVNIFRNPQAAGDPWAGVLFLRTLDRVIGSATFEIGDMTVESTLNVNTVFPVLKNYGTNLPGLVLRVASPTSTFVPIAAFTPFAQTRSDRGLVSAHGLRSTDLRVLGDDHQPEIHIAKGNITGGPNRQSEIIFSEDLNGFTYGTGDFIRIATYGDITTAPKYETAFNMKAEYGQLWTYKAGGTERVVLGIGMRAGNIDHPVIAFGPRTMVYVARSIVVGTGNSSAPPGDVDSTGAFYLRNASGRFYVLEVGALISGTTYNATLRDMGTDLSVIG